MEQKDSSMQNQVCHYKIKKLDNHWQFVGTPERLISVVNRCIRVPHYDLFRG